MGFKLSNDARRYFSTLDDSVGAHLDSIWDRYYLCLVVGLQENLLSQEMGDDEFAKNFVGDYHEKRYEIIAALIATELKRQGISEDDEKAVSRVILDLTADDSETRLSTEGEKRLNQYAQGGFDFLREKIPEARDLDIFLKQYLRLLHPS